MENKTVKELKEIAKERKIKYYYKLRKEDLVRALQPIVHQAESLRSSRPVAAPRSIAQSPIFKDQSLLRVLWLLRVRLLLRVLWLLRVLSYLFLTNPFHPQLHLLF